jgi:hypothetical protein
MPVTISGKTQGAFMLLKDDVVDTLLKEPALIQFPVRAEVCATLLSLGAEHQGAVDGSMRLNGKTSTPNITALRAKHTSSASE